MRMKKNAVKSFCTTKNDTFCLTSLDRGLLFNQSGPVNFSLLSSRFCHFVFAIKGGVITFIVNAWLDARMAAPARPNVI